ncbi:hypothetical protein [Thalassobacillus sp. C254]|uniref:hypothetical protein n=1 Tax=Thalassobacillus sp. C254 TaxID=1225341 RepID=UPI0012EE798A|nr:hypothetical protein [Thalassobacillus sp. C254]
MREKPFTYGWSKFTKRQKLQEEYKELFTRLRELDKDLPEGKPEVSVAHAEKELDKGTFLTATDNMAKEVNEDPTTSEQYDKRLSELEAFLEQEKG